MNREEARGRFSAAYDGELDQDQERAFQALLAVDDAMRQEYAEFCQVMRAASALSQTPDVDLLSGVQQRLRARSAGRFYRDRFAELRGRRSLLGWMLTLAILGVLLTVVWFVRDGAIVLSD